MNHQISPKLNYKLHQPEGVFFVTFTKSGYAEVNGCFVVNDEARIANPRQRGCIDVERALLE
ncbi:hypothetical protein DMA11_19075 [Marinilabiliaceae bacterium JC017]|nr:hypothetical protein DMA11_19075 [Marinilabiliaceae bacterium JC017]